MKNIIKIFISLLFLISCTNVYFENPQPTYLENVKKIPSKFHGSFEHIEKKPIFISKGSAKRDEYVISDEFCVINNDTLKVGSNDLVVKCQGNNLYVNLKKDSVYELNLLNRFNYFGADSLIVKTIFIDEDNWNESPYYFNTVNYIFTIIDSSHITDFDGGVIINDSLNINELNTLLNLSISKRSLKFNKKQL